ncbi:MAG: hypothetical protein JEZ11_27575 [Desulfobacterales bacterium]|nr:hypothetical protein [Desulfobacterales bacterium]
MKLYLEVDMRAHPAWWQKLAVMAHHLGHIATEILGDNHRGTIEDINGRVIGRWKVEDK